MFTFLVASALAASAASAGTPQTGPRAWREHDANGQCMYGHGYADSGRTEIVLIANRLVPPGHLGWGLKNDNWSIKAGDIIAEPITVRSGPISMSGNALAMDHRIMVIVPMEDVRKFAASNPAMVVVSRGNQLLTRLGVSGFSAGWAGFAGCLANADAERARQLKQEQEANPDIAVDPFAPTPSKPPH